MHFLNTTNTQYTLTSTHNIHFLTHIQSVLILLDKVPDEPELLHRHVCALMSTVEEKGGEWVDAGEAFKKLTAAKK